MIGILDFDIYIYRDAEVSSRCAEATKARSSRRYVERSKARARKYIVISGSRAARARARGWPYERNSAPYGEETAGKEKERSQRGGLEGLGRTIFPRTSSFRLTPDAERDRFPGRLYTAGHGSPRRGAQGNFLPRHRSSFPRRLRRRRRCRKKATSPLRFLFDPRA